MSMLNIVGLQMSNLTAYNEYLTDIIVAVIVYLSAFALVIRMLFDNRRKNRPVKNDANAPKADADKPAEDAPKPDEAQTGKGGDQA